MPRKDSRPSPPARSAVKRIYAAFISYSHGADSPLAGALQSALQRFAKPWYAVRALRVFRDKTNLSANPALWSTIVRALEASHWLLLMASPESAASPYVAKEIAWWREHRAGSSRVLIALSDGELAWDSSAGDFDWRRTTALGPACRGLFAEEPLWVDLRALREPATHHLRHAAFRDAVADIAAPLRDIPKHVLIDRDREEHRKLLTAGGVLLAIIALLAFGVWRIDAIARERKDTVVSHELAGKAYLNLPNNPELSALLALAGYARRQTGLAEVALRHALARLSSPAAPLEVAEVPAGAPSPVSARHRSGKLVASGFADGRIALAETAGAPPLATLRREEAVTALAFNPRGRSVLSDELLATGDAHGNLHVVDVAPLLAEQRGTELTAIQLPTEPGGIVGLGFTANGKCLAVAGGGGQLLLREVNAWATLATLAEATDAATGLAVQGSDRFVLRLNDGRAREYRSALCADKDELCALADRRLLRPLTEQERRRFVPGEKASDDEDPLPPRCAALVERVLGGRR